MWHGGYYTECNRKQQARECYCIIEHMGLTSQNSFRDIIDRLPLPPIMVARIRHLLYNEDFGRIMEGDYE